MEPIAILREYLENSQVGLRGRTYYAVYRVLQFPNMTSATFTPEDLLCYAQREPADRLLERLRELLVSLWGIYNDCVNRHPENQSAYETERQAIEALEGRLR